MALRATSSRSTPRRPAWSAGSLLLLLATVASAVACSTPKQAPSGPSATGRVGPISVESFYIAPPRAKTYPSGGSATVQMILFNAAKERDVLLGASSSRAGSVLVQQDGRTNSRVNIPPQNRTTRGLVVLLQQLDGSVAPGDRVPVTLRFQNAGAVTLSAPVRG